ncbi:MAG: hypothetical protein FD128_2543 [Hyphomonadaceae bacterium]|nr:MAG: hypothetical protein FD128_2543 [Hyphomonadaceae bacterium]
MAGHALDQLSSGRKIIFEKFGFLKLPTLCIGGSSFANWHWAIPKGESACAAFAHIAGCKVGYHYSSAFRAFFGAFVN